MPSGTPVSIEIAETFDLVGGRRLQRWLGSRTFALHAVSAAALGASFHVKPSRSFPPFALRQGAIDLAARLPADPFGPRGTVIGPAGGEAVAPTGERLRVPGGAAAEHLPVVLSPLPSAEVPLAAGGGISVLAGVLVDLHGGALSQPAALSVPAPAGLPPEAVVLVVELVEADDLTRAALVAVGRLQQGALVAVADVFGDGSLVLPGVRRDGRYAFVQVDAPVGFLTGIVTGAGGAPLAGALVDVGFPIAALSDAAGRYIAAGPAGTVQLRVTDPVTKDTSATAVSIAAGGVSTASVSLGPTPPFVAAVNPPNGAANVPRAGVISITFSEPIDPSSLTAGAIVLAAGGTAVSGVVSLAPGNAAAVFRPGALLASDTTYRLTVAATVRDLAGHAMAAPFVSEFRTVDETPPPRPAAGQLSATIPDASGQFVLSGTQGTADPGGVVLVKNLRTNALTTLTPNADGSFSGTIAASRSDRLELTIQDAAGNRTTVPVPPFRGADGSVVVGEAGGRVEGPGGVFVEIPAGALPEGTVVKVEPVAETQLPLPAPDGFPFVGGVRLDLGGVVPRQALDLGVPAPSSATAQDQVIVARPVQLPRRLAWTVVDRAHLEDGRYQTASLPFVGIAGEGTYAFLSTQGRCVSYVTVHYQLEFHLVIVPSGLPWVFPAASSNITTTPAVCDSTLQIQVVDPSTDLVIQQITEHAPAVPDEILDSPQILTTDRRPPVIISAGDLTSYRVDQVEIRFSEPMDAESVKSGFAVEDSDGNVVPGTVDLLEGGRLAVFRPTAPFRLGEQYSVFIFGAKDLAGNFLQGEQLTFTPFSPRSLSSLGVDTRLRAALEKCTASGACSTSVIDEVHIGDTLFMANGLRTADQRYTDAAEPKRLVVASVTDPLAPTLIGFHPTETNPRVLAAVPQLAFTLPSGFSFAGDMLLVAGGGRVPGGELPAKLEFYDVTACRARPPTRANCLDPNSAPLRRRFLSTVTGIPPRSGVPPEAGVPLQMAVLRELQPDGRTSALIAYTLVTPIGIEAVDVLKAFDLPQDQTASDGPDGLVRGNFLDLAVLKNRLLALERDEVSGSTTLSMFGADLSRMSQVTLPGPAARLTAVENFVLDIDRDGNLGAAENDDDDRTLAINEIFDLAVVSSGPLDQGAACAQTVPCGELYVVDLSPLTSLEHAGVAAVVARIPIQGPAFGVQIDPHSRTAYVEIRGRGLGIVDLGFLIDVFGVFGRQAPASGLIDADGNGVDDRVLRIVRKEDIVATDVRVDVERGIAYVNGATTGLELIQISNNCGDLRLDFRTTQARAGDLAREQRLLLDTVAAVSAELRAAGIADVAFLEQGSGSCFWRGLDTCHAFTPGSSDHDLEVFVPMSQVVQAQAILDGYIRREQKRLAALGDLTMFAMPKEPFVSAELLNGTPMNRSGDASGDLGMGRQSLLLLWLLEGEYVDDPNTEPIDYIGSLPPLDTILTRLREKSADHEPVLAGEPTGIPRLEGYEWSLLQEFNFYKAGALVRIKGACDASGALNSPTVADIDPTDPFGNMNEIGLLGRNCEDELRTVAKAAIRTAFARLIADDRANAMVLEGRQIRNEAGEVIGVLDLSRQNYRRAGMCLGTTTPRNAPADPFAYGEKPCRSFEEFIMSMVIESARRGYDVFPAAVYGADILPWIYRFYCVKVGRHCESLTGEPAGFIIESDQQANEFIARAIAFIEKTKAATEHVYRTTIANDTKRLADLVVPGASFPFLLAGPEPGSDGIAAACTKAGVGGITLESTRADLRRCNEAIVKKKVEGAGDLGIRPVDVIERTETRKALEKAIGVRRYVRKNFRVRAVNRAPHSVPSAILTMYEGDGVDTREYQPKLSTEILRLEGSRTRVIATEPDPDRPGDERPVFPTFFDVDALRALATPSNPRAIAFFLDPERRIPEERKKDNQAAFFYYVLDRQNPNAVPSQDTPAFAIEDTSPDPLCIRPPPLKLELTAKAAGIATPLGVKELTVSVAQQVLLTYRVENLGTEPLENVVVKRNGEPVFTLSELRPAGVEIRTEPFVSTVTGTFDFQATALAATAEGDSIGPEHDRVFIHVTAANQLFDIQFFDHSPLREPTHPFSRFLANHDDHGKDVPLIGAVTDGSQDGAGGRLRIVIKQLKPGIPVDVSIADGELTGVVDGVGWLEHQEQVAVLELTGIMPDAFGEATVYYTPPPVFVREQHRQHDLARQERRVILTVSQNTVGRTQRPIVLRRPPVFLVHGLLSQTDTWNRFQPLVPSSGVSLSAIPGYDGRFDLFAIGSPFASATFAREAEAIKAAIKARLSEYLPGFSIGRVDVVGHSMGAVLIRRLANEFLTIGPSGSTGADPKNVPFRKLIALDAPFLGSPLADKIVEIRSRLPVEPSMPAIDLLSVSDDDVLTPELKVEAKLEKCAFVIQTLGLTPRFFLGGAVEDLQTTSPEIARLQAAGIQVPTHHIVGETTVPELGIGFTAEALWVALAEFCNLTPDSSTVEASIQAKLGILAAKTFVPVLRSLKTPKLSKGAAIVPVLELSDNQRALLDAYEKIKSFHEAADSDDPVPVFSSPENDRIVEGVSQAAGLPANSGAVSFVFGRVDHNTILDSSSAPTCGDLSGPLPRATDSNGDGTPDVTCRVIYLLEADPAGPLFFRSPSP
ncbi:MAG TPA: Ig-like domain-containing protein [Vicinamibacterales bacterium]|nr:Ig-like domain-containing protein [Vicinamibacterales bacterium]